MIEIAVSILLSVLVLCGTGWLMFRAWLESQKEPPEESEAPMTPAQALREGPAATATWERRAWEDEQRRAGKNPDEIQPRIIATI